MKKVASVIMIDNLIDIELKYRIDHLMKKQRDEVSKAIKEVLRRNYPEVDVDNEVELQKLIQDELITIQQGNIKMDTYVDIIDDRFTKIIASSFIKVFKELR